MHSALGWKLTALRNSIKSLNHIGQCHVWYSDTALTLAGPFDALMQQKKGCKLNWKLSVSSCQNQQSSFTLSQAECHVCYNIKCGYLFNVTAGAFTVCLASCLDCPSTCCCCCCCKYCQGVTSQINFGHPLLRACLAACLAVCLPEMRLWTASNRSAVKEPKANSLVCVAAKWVSLEMNVQLAPVLSLSLSPFASCQQA